MGTVQTVELSVRGGAIMNDLADYILDNMPELAATKEQFQLIADSKPSHALALGEDAIIKIILVKREDEDADQFLKKIAVIDDQAKGSGLDMIVKFDPPLEDQDEAAQ